MSKSSAPSSIYDAHVHGEPQEEYQEGYQGEGEPRGEGEPDVEITTGDTKGPISLSEIPDIAFDCFVQVNPEDVKLLASEKPTLSCINLLKKKLGKVKTLSLILHFL